MLTLKVNKRVDRISIIGKRFPEEVDAALSKAASSAASVAKQLVPVKTGALRDSIAVSLQSRMRYLIVAAMFYAGYVEFGTVNQLAQPYLTPATEIARVELLRDLMRIQSLLS